MIPTPNVILGNLPISPSLCPPGLLTNGSPCGLSGDRPGAGCRQEAPGPRQERGSLPHTGPVLAPTCAQGRAVQPAPLHWGGETLRSGGAA